VTSAKGVDQQGCGIFFFSFLSLFTPPKGEETKDIKKVIFNSNPLEFRQDSVVLDVSGQTQVLPNDYVWIFAGGEPPTAFLKKIGVGFGAQDLTSTLAWKSKL